MKPDLSPSISFDRPKLFLFKFLAHQIHPFAYAVNTFLQPALDDCRRLLATNPHETFQLLLSLSQTFTRFAPDSDLIYDDIQEFACSTFSSKIKTNIDQFFFSSYLRSIERRIGSMSSVVRRRNTSTNVANSRIST